MLDRERKYLFLREKISEFGDKELQADSSLEGNIWDWSPSHPNVSPG